jgi:hypothetical protein
VSHDSEREAAAYLGGAMRARRRRGFEAHLIQCEDCWREVAVGRRGRRLAEATRELAPQGLRETIRAAVAAFPASRRRLRLPLVGATLVVVAAGAFVAGQRLGADQPRPIVRAVADFREGRMPTEAPPGAPAPDLAPLRLSLTSAASGSLAGLHVDAFSYRDASGRRLLLYLSDTAFPIAAGARQSTRGGPWRARIGDLELLCSQRPHALLAISNDATLLDDLAEQLAVEGVPA